MSSRVKNESLRTMYHLGLSSNASKVSWFFLELQCLLLHLNVWPPLLGLEHSKILITGPKSSEHCQNIMLPINDISQKSLEIQTEKMYFCTAEILFKRYSKFSRVNFFYFAYEIIFFSNKKIKFTKINWCLELGYFCLTITKNGSILKHPDFENQSIEKISRPFPPSYCSHSE